WGDREPAVGAGQERDAGGLRLSQIGDTDPVPPLGHLDAALLRRRLVRLGEIDQVFRMRQGRTKQAAALFHRGDAFVIQIEAVEDQVDPGARRVQGRLAPDRVRDDFVAEPMALVRDDIGLLYGTGDYMLSVR